ncbi:hypothetical protein L484_005783 [Morus notabilis]|uniref:Uncharacterized protein n=1 Tax=Morus notabilis TaxID=981085 RepID=W9S918_9ROSA|nr:hypothetical protein L484_005783 [Morus notabilis]
MSCPANSHLPLLPLLTIFCLATFLFVHVSQAIVSSDRRFTYTNKDDNLGSLRQAYDYGGTYRSLPIYNFPFTLCFYSETHYPNAFFLVLCMGDDSNHVLCVWEANRDMPIREGATLTL